jgi:hypothetical protein
MRFAAFYALRFGQYKNARKRINPRSRPLSNLVVGSKATLKRIADSLKMVAEYLLIFAAS